MRKPKQTAPKLPVWTSIDSRVARRRRRWFQIRGVETGIAALALLGWVAFAALVNAQPEPGRLPESDSESTTQERGAQTICQMIEGAAAAHDLPFEFFARVIWQESRFRSDAKGPVTRSGQQAQGIAQFMPGTATERSLHDPFDPAQALPKSAEFLRELRMQFGNLGLAAAAYNAGPSRVRDWLAGRRTLPSETQAYVRIVTGRRAEEWRLQGTALDVAIPVDMPCGMIAARAPTLNKKWPSTSTSPWGVQLIGDLSEEKALAAYRALQKRREAILGNYEPMIIRTATAKVSTAPVWTRIRVEAESRQDADALCAQLRAAGEICLVQRN